MSAHVPEAASVLRERPYWRWLAATLLVGMPGFMAPLAFVLVALYATGDRRVGGLMVAAEVVAMAVCAPAAGRLVDRIGPRRGLVAMGLASGLVFLALAYVTGARGPALALVVAAGLTGVAAAPRRAAGRTLLDEVVPGPLVREAVGLGATVMEMTVLCAPLLIAVLALLTPVAVVAAMAACVLAGAALVPGLPRLQAPAAARPAARSGGVAVFLRSRAFWFWVAVQAAFGQVLGTVETGALPWARHIGLSTAAAASALAVLSAAGILASLLYLRLDRGRWRTPPRGRALVMVAVLATGGLGFAFARTWAAGAVAMAVTGAATVPLNGLASHAAAGAMPEGRRAEGFAILGSVYSGGYALGGLALAALPLRWTLLSAPALSLVALALTPLWR